MQTHLTHKETISEYCHASVILDYIDVLHSEDRNKYRPVLKTIPQLFFSHKTFSSFITVTYTGMHKVYGLII